MPKPSERRGPGTQPFLPLDPHAQPEVRRHRSADNDGHSKFFVSLHMGSFAINETLQHFSVSGGVYFPTLELGQACGGSD